ncbi:hypothetical protein [Streptomyces sp. YIM S03343]
MSGSASSLFPHRSSPQHQPLPRSALHEVFPPVFRPTASSPRPPGTDVPPTSEIPLFPPVRVRGGWYGFQRLVRRCAPILAAGPAVAAAALLATGPRAGTEAHPRVPVPGRPVAEAARQRPAASPPARPVAAPVRIADAATVRLLRPGDRVDIIAAEGPAAGADAHVIARGARVAKVPEAVDDGESGALVVLSVPRSTAARLVGASATARLAVTLC